MRGPALLESPRENRGVEVHFSGGRMDAPDVAWRRWTEDEKRHAHRMYYEFGLSYEEIARRLERTMGAVIGILHRTENKAGAADLKLAIERSQRAVAERMSAEAREVNDRLLPLTDFLDPNW